MPVLIDTVDSPTMVAVRVPTRRLRPVVASTKIGTVLVLLLLVVWPGASSGSAAPDRSEADALFSRQLEALAAKCDQLDLSQQAKWTRRWAVPRDPRRHYFFVLDATDVTKPGGDAPRLVRFWNEKFVEYRRDHASRLYELAVELARTDREPEAFQMVHEVLYHDPDHADARRVLGYYRSTDTWRKRFRKPKPKTARQAHPLFGWPARNYWTVESEHFRLTTNADVEGGLEATDYLERVYSAWQQLFFSYWSVPGRLAARMEGRDSSLGPSRTFQVVLFKDRDEYVDQLSRFEPQIGVSVGYYSQARKTAFFYAAASGRRSAWSHEASHQFFQESGVAVPKVGERSNFWVVEGAALYMESFREHGPFVTTGGADADRLQFARYRRLNEGFYVPTEELVGWGRTDLQAHDELRRLYSQSAGLAHYFIDSDHGRRVRDFVRYLAEVYQGKADQRAMVEFTGMECAHVDRDYVRFLNVTDEDIPFIDSGCRNLCLGHTDVTDRGLDGLADCAELQWLDLSFTSVTDRGIQSLAAAPRLEQLSLESTAISDRGLEAIEKFSRLQELDLSQTSVGDGGMPRIARLKNLQTLWLTATKVSDRGLEPLRALRELTTLNVERTAVTADGLKTLKRSLPDVTIDH